MSSKNLAPKKRPSADRTREIIIAAARKLFVQHGFAATSISQIAKTANITNQSLIYHHFSNKVELWKQIKQSLVSQYLPVIQERLSQIETPGDFIEAFINTTAQVFEESPDLKRMADWQRLEPESLKISGLSMISTGEVVAMLASFQQAGTMRADLSAADIIQFLITFASTAADIPPSSFRNDILIEMLGGAKRVLLR